MDDETIPEDLKIKLYTHHKRKYNGAREDIGKNIADEDDGGYEDNNYKVNIVKSLKATPLFHFVDNLSNNKKALGAKVADVILQNTRYIRWDHMGNLTHPGISNIHQLSLKRFIDILIYRKRGLECGIEMVSTIIKPFREALAPYIQNTELANHVHNRIQEAKPSKYVSWM